MPSLPIYIGLTFGFTTLLTVFFFCKATADIQGKVPQLMTFEGSNFDILSGISSLLVYYFGFVKNKLGRKAILIWNVVCLGLLFNIVIRAVLSAPFPIQQFAFDQPNIALLYFPFVWLPCCVVPLVLFSHLAAFRQLIVAGQNKKFTNSKNNYLNQSI